MKLLAPLDEFDNFEALAASPADEFFCGLLPKAHVQRYSNLYSLNRRAFTRCNFNTFKLLGRAVAKIGEVGKPVVCAFNSTFYLDDEYPAILEYAQRLRDIGVDDLIISDVGLGAYLRNKGFSGRLHLGVDTGAFNAATVNFLVSELAVSRIILNRHLNIDEVISIISSAPEPEYEVIAYNAPCRHVAAFCGNLHGADPSSGKDNWEGRRFPCWCIGDVEVVQTDDAQRGEQLRQWLGSLSSAKHGGCGACALPLLADAGVAHVKIAGRGAPTEAKLRDITFMAAAMELSRGKGPEGTTGYAEQIIKLRLDHYGETCGPRDCYYEV